MSITWRDQMSVGVKALDDDHKHLIDIVNRFETQLTQGLDEAVMKATIKQLVDYITEHFAREEKLQLTVSYPFADVHKEEHEALKKRVQGIIRTYFVEKSKPVDKSATTEMLAFLKTWLMDHILGSDMQMKPYLEAYVSLRSAKLHAPAQAAAPR